jgi:peptidylprolyl isomerase
MRKVAALAAACAVLAVAASFAMADEKKDEGTKMEYKWQMSPTGLKYQDLKEGDGPTPKNGQTCVVHYTGWLWEGGEKGKKFDSSVDRGQPFEFTLGMGRVIKGWDQGVSTMKVGGKRLLLVPPQLGYGARGAGGLIPPNATLLFEVELLGVK